MRRIKQIIGSILVLAMSVSMAIPTFAATFSDMNDKEWEWAKSYVEEMADMGLINGYEDGTFRPGNSVTHQEALALFARAMGSANASNDEVNEIALKQYGDILKPYGLYANEEVAYLLYRGALKTTELDVYLKGSLRDQPMKRYEAAVIITKALGKESEAKNNVLTDLSYTDALDIPIDAINYVYQATKDGIMQGMGNGTFSPNTDVLRSQMAVMLYRTVDKIGLSIETGKLIKVDTATRNITAKDSEGFQYLIGYSDSVVMKVEGTATQYADMPNGVDAVFTYYNDSLVYVDTLTSIPDETVTAIYSGYSNTSGTLKVSVYKKASGTNDITTYTCANDVSLMYNGSPATINSFVKEDQVELAISRGKVTSISGGPKTVEIKNATVKSVEIDPDFKLTITHADKAYNEKSYNIDSNVIVKKNGTEATFRDIYIGDKVNITTEYGVITKVIATSDSRTVEGTIAQVSISTLESSITAKVNGEEQTFQVPKSATVLVNGEDGTLYDLRVGDVVKLTIESQAVTKVAITSSTATVKQLMGTVTAVNSSYGFITISVAGTDGNVTSETIFADKDVTVLDINGNKKAFKNVAVGQTVSVVCSFKNGANVASSVIIMSEA